MNILVCNSSLKSVYIDRPYFIEHPGSVIHTLYGWLVIFISFCFDKFLIKSSNTLRFLICSFIYLSIHSLICIFTVFKVIPNVCYDIFFRFIPGGFLGQLWLRQHSEAQFCRFGRRGFSGQPFKAQFCRFGRRGFSGQPFKAQHTAVFAAPCKGLLPGIKSDLP